MENDNDDVDDKTDFKQNLTGYVYQLKLLLLFLWRGLKSGSCNKFQLGTELKEAEKFDDAIFFYEKAAKIYVRYMQAKYSRFDNKVLEFKDFVSGWSGARCNLKKYFISYRKIKQRPYQVEIDDVIICTNIPFGQLTLKKNATNELTFEDVSGKSNDEIFDGMKKYQLKAVISCPDLHEELKQCTNLYLLAKELVNCIFKTTKGYNLDLQDYWISGYFNVLIKEKIIEQKDYYKLSEPKNSDQKNKEFRKYFIEKMMEKVGMVNENVKFDTNCIDRLRNHKRDISSDSATLEEIAEVLVQSITSNAVPVPDKIFDIDNLVKKERSFFFTDTFINNGNDISPNAKAFRSTVLKICEKEVAKILDKQQIFAADAFNGIKVFETNTTSISRSDKEEKVAKDLIQNIFYKKELTNIFKAEYSFLKDVFNLTGMNTLQFTNDFAKNNNETFRKLLLKLYVEEKIKNTTIKCKQNLEKYSTIIEQLKQSYNKAKTTKSQILKFDQTNWKKNKVEGILEALNGSIFVATNERDKIQFNDDIFTDVTRQIPCNDLAEKFKSNLKYKFKKDFEKLKIYKIEYVNYPPHFYQLKEDSTDITLDIETFRKKLFIVNTPSETELMTDISKEMGDRFNLLDGDTMTYKLFQDVLDWAKEKEDKLLNTNKFLKYLNNIEARISEKFEVGCSLQYMSKLEEYSIIYNEIMDELISFLGLPPLLPNHQRILHIQTNETLLMAIKVRQTINSYPYFKMKDYFIFNPLKSLLRMEKADKHVSKAFGSKSDILIIVEKQEIKGSHEFCDVLSKIIINNPHKKIVVISNEISQFISALKTPMNKEFIHILPQAATFNDLTPKSQNMIMENNKIIFQGNPVFLSKLMNCKEATKLIDSNTLEKIIIDDEIEIGKPVDTCEEIENHIYRPRQLRLIEVNLTLFDEKNLHEKNLFAIEGLNSLTKTSSAKSFDIYDNLINNCETKNVIFSLEISQAEEEFQQLVEKYPDRCIHWLKKGRNKLVWFHSYIPSSMTMSSKFKQHISREDEYVLESFFGDCIKQSRVVIISDKAGMGKSTILTKFSKTLKTEEHWVIKINLNQYTPVLLKMKQSTFKNDKQLYLNFDKFNREQKDFGKLVLESLITLEQHDKQKITFENQMFNHFFTKRGILYMFDGFDEINPDYGGIVLNLLQMLRKNDKNRIWITSRTNFKRTLEDTFGTFAYDMKPFDRNDQEIFFKQFWISNYKKHKGIEMPNQNRIHTYVKQLLNQAPQKILEIIGIPLQTKMLAEIFQEKHDNDKIAWVSCFEYVEAEVAPVEFNISPKISDVCTLYKNF